MTWRDSAREAIAEIHAALPADATFEQRKQALRDGYPFGQRAYTPYKIWLKEQRQYLAKYDPAPAGPLLGGSIDPPPAKISKAPLSAAMVAALDEIQARGGRLVRYQGGYWSTPAAECHGGRPAWYIGTPTVNALVSRGRLAFTEWHDPAKSLFPIAATLEASPDETPPL